MEEHKGQNNRSSAGSAGYAKLTHFRTGQTFTNDNTSKLLLFVCFKWTRKGKDNLKMHMKVSQGTQAV